MSGGGVCVRLDTGGAGGIWTTRSGGIWKRIRNVLQFVSASDVQHGINTEVGMGQRTPKRWKRLPC